MFDFTFAVPVFWTSRRDKIFLVEYLFYKTDRNNQVRPRKRQQMVMLVINRVDIFWIDGDQNPWQRNSQNEVRLGIRILLLLRICTMLSSKMVTSYFIWSTK